MVSRIALGDQMRSRALSSTFSVARLLLNDACIASKITDAAYTPGFVSLKAFSPGWAASGNLRHFSTQRPAPLPPSAPSGQSAWDRHVLYRGRGIRIFRVLVRLKIFQLTGIAALAVPITTFLSTGDVGPMQAVIATALVVGSGAASTALWYFSRRYVGELSLLIPKGTIAAAAGQEGAAFPGPRLVRFSVLDFWGNREDVDVDAAEIVPPLAGLPPAAVRALAAEPALPVHVTGDRKLILSLRYGHIVDGPALKALLEGRSEDAFHIAREAARGAVTASPPAHEKGK